MTLISKKALPILVVLVHRDISAHILQNGDSCRVLTLIPFTDLRTAPDQGKQQRATPTNSSNGTAQNTSSSSYGYGEWPDAETLSKASFSMMAAAEMARRHFNARDTSVIPELGDLQATCNITMPEPEANVSYINSEYDRRVVVKEVLNAYNGMPGPICCIIGPSDLLSIAATAIVTESAEIPQISYQTENSGLGVRNEFPNLARIQSESKNFAAAVIRYINRDVLNRESAAIVYDENDYGTDFGDPAFIEMNSLAGFSTYKATFVQSVEPSYRKAFQDLAKQGHRTILFVTDRPAVLATAAPLADEFGLLGEGYVWFLIGATLPVDFLPTLKYQVDSSIDKLLRGAGIFTNYDPFVYLGKTDPFLTAWRSQEASIVEQLNRIQPTSLHGGSLFVANSSYFETEIPAKYASFIYDAVITAGISACRERSDSAGANTIQRRTHIQEMLRTEFSGASGPVKFQYNNEDAWNSRDSNGTLYGLYNIRPGAAVDENNMRSYDAVLTSIYSHNNTVLSDNGNNNTVLSDNGSEENGPFWASLPRGAWAGVEGTEFLFFDGTTREPMPTRTVVDANYLSPPAQITGYVLTGISLLLIAAASLWIFACRDTPLVKAAQPVFLYLLCFGAALVASSAIFLSFDEGKGKSQSELDLLCSTFPWFFVVGYLTMYCALLGKLWRLSKLLQMRRRIVRIQHVILGPTVIIAVSLVVLSAWQITDPLVWERYVISLEPLATYGLCNSLNHGAMAFGIPLALLIVVTVLITAALSWKLRGVQSDLAESHCIFAGIFLHLQTWLVGVPVLYITHTVSKEATYIMIVLFTFTLATSMVMLVVGPKMFVWARSKGFFAFLSDAATTTISIGQGPKTYISGLSDPGSGNQMSKTKIIESSGSISLPSLRIDTSDSHDLEGPETQKTSGLPDSSTGNQSSNQNTMQSSCTAPTLKIYDNESRDRIAELEKQVSQLQTELNNTLDYVDCIVTCPEEPGLFQL